MNNQNKEPQSKKRFISYNKIRDYGTLVKDIRHSAQFVRYDEEKKEVIMDRLAPMPVLELTFSEKIHGCFEKNSLVTLANGEQVPIRKITKGTWILSYNHKTKQQEIKEVLKSFSANLDKDWCKLVFDKTEIICTKDHKIWTENRGYVEASSLLQEDIFKSFD